MKINFSQLAGTTSPEKPDYWDYFGSRLADHTRIPAEATVLDIGTGSGAVLIPTALAAGFHGKAIGIDIDTDWFRHVIPRLRRLAIGNTALARMDASGLGFADGSFDHVLCGFVGWDYCYDFLKMQFTGPDVRLSEITRILRDGGSVSLSSWERQTDLEWLGDHSHLHFPAYVAEQNSRSGNTLMVYSKENAKGLESILRAGGYRDIEVIAETAEFVSRYGQPDGGNILIESPEGRQKGLRNSKNKSLLTSNDTSAKRVFSSQKLCCTHLARNRHDRQPYTTRTAMVGVTPV